MDKTPQKKKAPKFRSIWPTRRSSGTQKEWLFSVILCLKRLRQTKSCHNFKSLKQRLKPIKSV